MAPDAEECPELLSAAANKVARAGLVCGPPAPWSPGYRRPSVPPGCGCFEGGGRAKDRFVGEVTTYDLFHHFRDPLAW